MYSFFVLGLIPGTDIQISFTMWLETVMLFGMSAYLVRHILRRRTYGSEIVPTIGTEFIVQPLPALWTFRIVVALLIDNAEHLLRSLHPAPAHEQDN